MSEEIEVTCVGCEGRPAPENNPCAVCGLSTPSPDLKAENAALVQRIIDALQAEQDRLDADQGDYLMDTKDCIASIREQFLQATEPRP